jgi:hypothetical protein
MALVHFINLAFSLLGILSAWHFVYLAFCLLGILSNKKITFEDGKGDQLDDRIVSWGKGSWRYVGSTLREG